MSDCLALDQHAAKIIEAIEAVAKDHEKALPRVNHVTVGFSSEGAAKDLTLWNFADGGGTASETPSVHVDAGKYAFGGGVADAQARASAFLGAHKAAFKEHKLKLKAEPDMGGFPLQILWLEAALRARELEQRLRARHQTWSQVFVRFEPRSNDVANADVDRLLKRVRTRLKPFAAVPRILEELAALLFATPERREWLISLAHAEELSPAQLQSKAVERIQELAREGAKQMNLDDVGPDDLEDAADDWWHHMGQEDCAQEFEGDADAKRALRSIKVSHVYQAELVAALRMRLQQG